MVSSRKTTTAYSFIPPNLICFLYFVAMFICVNGHFAAADKSVFSSANSSYRYGDGLFETIRCDRGKMLLKERHFQRLFNGMQLLGYQLPAFFTQLLLEQKISELLLKNHCQKLARVRLSVYRGEGGLFDNNNKPGYLIECWPLELPAVTWNENGLVIGVYPDAAKAMDSFANLKSASFLPYSMAAQYAKEQRWNDAIVLNTAGAMADTSIANIFLIQRGLIMTPSLDQGCIAGVARAHLLDNLRLHGYDVQECPLAPAMLNEADEVFLTNAIRGLRWVQSAGDKKFKNELSKELFERFIKNTAESFS